MPEEFPGTALPLDEAGLEAATSLLEIGQAELWAVIKVETGGCGFLPDSRPIILFERHKFSRLTGHKFDTSHPDISNPIPRGFGKAGANQYNRLERAIELDRTAALCSASWGLGQVLGSNAEMVGFADAEKMVTAMKASENAHMEAMANFIIEAGITGALRNHNWARFAERYNGPSFKEHEYDEKLRKAFQRFSDKGLPDLMVRDAQIYLGYLGFASEDDFLKGFVDGDMGPRTRKALNRFQVENELRSRPG